MKDIQLDKNGIPTLSREDIETYAERILAHYDPICLDAPSLTPISAIAGSLRESHNIEFVFDHNLGFTPDGREYLGRCNLSKGIIYISSSLDPNDVYFAFTLAHELSHYILHRKYKPAYRNDSEEAEISDTNDDLNLNRLVGDNPRMWAEWQANKLAVSLLMPRRTAPIAVSDIQIGLGILRNQGVIYLDNQSCNISNYKAVVQQLIAIYNVSKTVIRYRLQELNLLHDISALTGSGPSAGPIRLNEILPEVFKNW